MSKWYTIVQFKNLQMFINDYYYILLNYKLASLLQYTSCYLFVFYLSIICICVLGVSGYSVKCVFKILLVFFFHLLVLLPHLILLKLLLYFLEQVCMHHYNHKHDLISYNYLYYHLFLTFFGAIFSCLIDLPSNKFFVFFIFYGYYVLF